MTQPDLETILKQARHASGTGNYPQAIQLAEQALKIDPQNADAIGRLGGSLAIFGKHHEAKRVFEQAISMNIITPQIIGDYAGLLNLEGQHEKALQVIERADTQFPNNMGILFVRIDVLATMSRYKEAYALLKPKIDADKLDFRSALSFLRVCRNIGREQEAIQISTKLLEDRTMAPSARMAYLFRFGLMLHEIGQYNEAFIAVDEANRLRWRGFDPEAHARSIDLLIERWSPDAIDRMGSSSIEDDSPVFIVGMIRSGTTLLEQVLNAHPDFVGIGERPFVTDIVKHLQGQELPSDVPHMHRTHLLNPGILKQAGEQYTRFLRQHDADVPHVIDKRPDNFLHLGLIATMLPNAHILHTARSLEDVATSCFLHEFYGSYEWVYSQETIADYIADYERLMQHWEAVFPNRIHTVSYESITQQFEPTVRAALDSMGTSWDDSCLDFHSSSRIANTASIDQVRQPIYTKAIGSASKYGDRFAPFREQLERRRALGSSQAVGHSSNPEQAT